ncbi:MAG: HAMP domain-containing protein [Chthoniobacterales bacterium]|nr:HAMP domain-containing protein [Chthoniobacterales bacterium]
MNLLPFRFRTFRGRLSFFFLSLVALLLATTFLIVLQANRRHAQRQIEDNLRAGSRIFSTLTERRLDELNEQARLLAYDYGFKQAFGSSADDPGTMRLAMQNFRDRIRASFMVLVSLEQQTLYDSDASKRDGAPFDLPDLINAAEAHDALEARGLVLRDGQLFAAVVVPLLTPEPAAWICLGFRIDDSSARELGVLTNLDVSFFAQTGEARGSLLASTLPDTRRQELLAAWPRRGQTAPEPTQMELGQVPFVTLIEPLEVRHGRVAVALQRNLREELLPFRALETALIALGVAGLLLSIIAVVAISGSVSRPVLRLAENARRVESGDYSPQPGEESERRDELGQLARSFQNMTEGLAERDKVRDLLGKVASPAIAAELTSRPLTLGGEEKKVTVLFCDLIDFTPLSERLTPSELLEVLNAYLTAMSRIVDAHGGVIDKYIGDALMALFGAPLEMPDQAAAALRTAGEMRTALRELNQRLFPEGEDALRFGIGIHTGIVIAGNVGSPTRYNYTVLGDGVNIAARLESLTRSADYATDIIVSEATLQESTETFRTRPLGEAPVKGKQELVKIHALLE